MNQPKILLMIFGSSAGAGVLATGLTFGSITGAGADGIVEDTTAVGRGGAASVCAEGRMSSGFVGAAII